MARKFLALAVCLPLLAIGFGIVRAELTIARGSRYLFEITGYDPRDLLRGHYLQFRLRLEPHASRESCDAGREDCCLCVEGWGSEQVVSVSDATCATAQGACAAWLDSSYRSQALRYYIAEAHAPELERRLGEAVSRRAAHALLSIDKAGQAHVLELRIDGAPIAGALVR